MRRGLIFGALGLAAALGVAAVFVERSQRGPDIETIGLTRPSEEAPALCPWRNPQADMQAFFPGADRYQTRIMVLSGMRVPLKQRLGPETPLDSNVLYAYPVFQGQTPRGAVMVQRAAGEYGALEIVVGVQLDGKIAGARLQRSREPDEVTTFLQSPHWLGGFQGKTAEDAWKIGVDLPVVPPIAQKAAETTAKTVRMLLIEWELAKNHLR